MVVGVVVAVVVVVMVDVVVVVIAVEQLWCWCNRGSNKMLYNHSCRAKHWSNAANVILSERVDFQYECIIVKLLLLFLFLYPCDLGTLRG